MDEQELSASLVRPDLTPLQAGSLLSGLRRHGAGERNAEIVLQRRFPELAEIDVALRANTTRYPYLHRLLNDIANRRLIDAATWDEFALDIVKQRLPQHIISFILMEITLCGLIGDNTYCLADAMRRSGKIYDYRAQVVPRKLVRRYPTGALSEKVALILPSLLVCAARTFPVASNFLVAKSLGFTGGTWDKLSSIPGFAFPKPGVETERLLAKEAVAMCVTHDDVAPCDRILYQMRSLTGTIESRPLIASSIASKQGALPADLLVLDVRYGSGAFLGLLTDAEVVAGEIVEIMGRWGMRCIPSYLPADEPNGVAIGNALEVCEAIAVMGSNISGPWDPDLIEAQWRITRGFFLTLLRNAFPEQPEETLLKFADTTRRSGNLLSGFKELLVAHNVEPRTADALCNDPISFYFQHPPFAVASLLDGVLSGLDQKRLGYFVNFTLGGGGNDFGGRINLRSGCILQGRVGQAIRKGAALALVYMSDDSVRARADCEDQIRACFYIDAQ